MGFQESQLDTSEGVSILGAQTGSDTFEIEQYGEARTLVADSQTIGQWPSQGAFFTDVGATRVMEEWSDRWDRFEPAQRGQILNGLRLFFSTSNDRMIGASEGVVER
jgi:hypothetical protein